jgi:mono/diheme cytochrome c family protein
VFDRHVDPASWPAFADPYEQDAPVEARARAYLHANCAFCHQAAAEYGQGSMDLRAFGPTSSMNILCRGTGDPDVDLRGALVYPGDPDRSLLVARMGALDARMPPLGSARIDDKGLDLVTRWVSGFDSCL